jgi:hypothetical protein
LATLAIVKMSACLGETIINQILKLCVCVCVCEPKLTWRFSTANPNTHQWTKCILRQPSAVSFHKIYQPAIFLILPGFPTRMIYEGRLKSSWTHLITPSWNFVEMQWWSLFWSTTLGKWCTSRKCSVDHWSLRNFPWSSLFMIGKAQRLHGARSELNSVFGLEKVDRWNPIRTSAIQPSPIQYEISSFMSV